MTITSPDQLDLETWSQNPIVTTAARRLGPDYDAVDLLKEMLGIMNELEERFPGIPFSDILACHDPGTVQNRQRIQTTLLDSGASLHDVEILVGSVPTDTIGEPEYELAYDDVPLRALVDVHGRSTTSAGHIRSLRQPITACERNVLDMIEADPEVSRTEISRRLGVTMGTIRKAIRKSRYQLWLERRERAAA